MSGAAFTPGPWLSRRIHSPSDTYGFPYFEVEAGPGSYGLPHGAPEAPGGFHLTGIICEADARLIAAAPDLYAALKFFRDQYGDRPTWPDGDVAALEMTDAALALVGSIGASSVEAA